jgi:hypothetical protein
MTNSCRSPNGHDRRVTVSEFMVSWLDSDVGRQARRVLEERPAVATAPDGSRRPGARSARERPPREQPLMIGAAR